MTPVTLLPELRRRRISFCVEDDRLRYRCPRGALTPELHERIRSHKVELLEELMRGIPQQPCYVCGRRQWWRSPYGGWFCSVCHPPAVEPVTSVALAHVAPNNDDLSPRARFLADIYRRKLTLDVADDGTIRVSPPEAVTPSFVLQLRVEREWLRDILTRPYDHDWVLNVRDKVIRRATERLGNRPLPTEAAEALDAVDHAAVQGSTLGVLAALAAFEAAIVDCVGNQGEN